MRIDDNAPSKLMQEYAKLEGLSMNMCSFKDMVMHNNVDLKI